MTLPTALLEPTVRRALAEVYGHRAEVIVVSGGGLRKGERFVVRVVREREAGQASHRLDFRKGGSAFPATSSGRTRRAGS